MNVTIPLSFLPLPVLKKQAERFLFLGEFFAKSFPDIQKQLGNIDMDVGAEQYISMCLAATSFVFIVLAILSTIFLLKTEFFFLGPIIAFLFSFGLFFMQLRYPSLLAFQKVRRLEADLLGSLSAIMIQVNAGIPLFEALVIVSRQEFGEVSKEFRKVTKSINAGVPQIEALEQMANKNPSPYFRSAIWQIINGMKEGSDVNIVLRSLIDNLTKGESIQIEKYGSQLSPVVTFYMMGAIILPALAITFAIAISSFLGLGGIVIQLFLWGILVFEVFFQFMFTGLIKSKRPSLLGE